MRQLLLLLAFSLSACVPSPYGLALGEECELNSDCDAPLVCRIGFCRVECTTSRDCAAGLDCVEDNEGLGGCQLPPETGCTNDSDCPAPLVCTMGECNNPCGSCTSPGPCRDCPPGSECVRDGDGQLGCFDPSTRGCVYSSECRADGSEFVCAYDGRCRIECRSDCDCRFGDVCREAEFQEDDVDGGIARGFLCVTPTPPERSSCLPDVGPGGGPDASADAGVDAP